MKKLLFAVPLVLTIGCGAENRLHVNWPAFKCEVDVLASVLPLLDADVTFIQQVTQGDTSGVVTELTTLGVKVETAKEVELKLKDCAAL